MENKIPVNAIVNVRLSQQAMKSLGINNAIGADERLKVVGHYPAGHYVGNGNQVLAIADKYDALRLVEL